MSYGHLTPKERYFIYHMRMAGWSSAKIGRRVGRHRSTISRELKRNASPWHHYLDDYAGRKAAARRQAANHRPCTDDAALMAHVERKIEARWSPEQIAGRLLRRPPKRLAGRTISHATIYRWIWACPRRSERLRPYLRVACKKRRKPYGRPSRRGQIPNRVSIEHRPAEAEARRRLGDWEADTVVGKARSGYVATCVDRASRYLVARPQRGCSAKETTASLHDAMRRLPGDHRRTLTVDNGREFAAHQRIGRLLGLAVYFAHPYSSGQRRTSDNTNGPVRQVLPKRMNFSELTDWWPASYVLQLNHRDRKCLNDRTPAEVY